MLLVSHFLLLSFQCKHNCKQKDGDQTFCNILQRPDIKHYKPVYTITTHLVVKSVVFPLQKFLHRSSRLEGTREITSDVIYCQTLTCNVTYSYFAANSTQIQSWDPQKSNKTHPLTETDDRPQAEAQSAAAAEAATQQPPHVHREGLPQTAVHAVYTGFEFLRRHLMEAHRYKTVSALSLKTFLCFIFFKWTNTENEICN